MLVLLLIYAGKQKKPVDTKLVKAVRNSPKAKILPIVKGLINKLKNANKVYTIS